MFAASRGISSRIVGAGRRNRDGPNGGHRKRKRRKMTLKQRMYLPFMWSTCIGTFLGFIVLCGGTAMCVVGYYAEYFATTETISNRSNGTDVVIIKDSSMQFHIKNLTFVGPIFMGVGAFIIVVACVVVFETRDKVLDLMEEKQRIDAKKRPDFYDLIIAQMKKKEEDILRGGQDNFAFGQKEKDLERENTKYLCTPRRVERGKGPTLTSSSGIIGKALRNIGNNIFTIDVDRNNTLTPVPINLFESKISDNPFGPVIIKPRAHTLAVFKRHTDKNPSLSCIHDMLKGNDKREQAVRRHSWLEDDCSVHKLVDRSKYGIAPLDISLSSAFDKKLVNIDTSISKHQSNINVEQNEEALNSSFLEEKYEENKSIGGVMGFSLDKEYSDSMTTGETCASLGLRERNVIANDSWYSSIDSNDTNESKSRTVVAVVHQTVVSHSHSDISGSVSSFDNPIQIFRPSPHRTAHNDKTEKHHKLPSDKLKHKFKNREEKNNRSSDEEDSLHLTDEIMKNFEPHENKNKTDRNIKNKDDGNLSDSSSNA